jgi:DnaA family protein
MGLRAVPTFSSFVVGANAEACHWVEAIAHGGGPDTVYLWGAAGVGKTHLLEAACREVTGRGERVGFVPLAQREHLLPAMLVGLETASLVCVDDLSAASGIPAWEQALFHLMNGLRAHDGRLLLAGRDPPAALGLCLPDLASRVGAALALRLAPPTDSDRAEALRRQARDRGFVLPEDVVAYLLRRFPRDLPSLLSQLDRLDAGSLTARRRVTLPLVRELLDER